MSATFEESTAGPKGRRNRYKARKQARKPVPTSAEPPCYPTRSRTNLATKSADVEAVTAFLNDPTFAATAIHQV
jgi:hypothetical protein